MDDTNPDSNPARKKRLYPCPFTPAELAALYPGQNALQIARALTQSGTPTASWTVYGWLEDAGIARHTTNAGRKVPCPFSATRLRQLYEGEHKSQKEIALLALPLMPERDKPPSQTIVTRWLREAAAALRTAQDAQQAWVKEHPDESRRRIAVSVAAMSPAKWAERPCTWCGRPVRRLAYKLRKAHVFCSKSCAAHWQYAPKYV